MGDSLAGFEAVPHHWVGSGDRGCKDDIGALGTREQNGWMGFPYTEQELTRQNGVLRGVYSHNISLGAPCLEYGKNGRMAMKMKKTYVATLILMASVVGCYSQAPSQISAVPLVETDIFSSVENGDLDNVKIQLQGGVDVNAKGQMGETPLLYAADRGNLDIVEFLLTNGADINAKDNKGWTPLLRASYRGHLDVVKSLVDKGADINEINADQTPLYAAANGGSRSVVEFLADQGAKIDAKDNNNWTPLMIAAMNGHLEVVQYLVQKGADINAKDDEGWLPVFEAARSGHIDVANFLLEQHGKIE